MSVSSLDVKRLLVTQVTEQNTRELMSIPNPMPVQVQDVVRNTLTRVH